MFSDGQVISEKILSIGIVGKLISTNFQDYHVNNLILHEEYDTKTFENDIALMKIKESFSFTQNFSAICFSQLASFPHAAAGTAIGYGSTGIAKDSQHSDVLRKVEIPIVDRDDCFNSDFEFFSKHLFEGNFCAGEINVHKGVCSGDSGRDKRNFDVEKLSTVFHSGGGFYVRINNHWYLQGLTSNTKLSEDKLNPTCNYASYAVFTNVTFYTNTGKVFLTFMFDCW